MVNKILFLCILTLSGVGKEDVQITQNTQEINQSTFQMKLLLDKLTSVLTIFHNPNIQLEVESYKKAIENMVLIVQQLQTLIQTLQQLEMNIENTTNNMNKNSKALKGGSSSGIMSGIFGALANFTKSIPVLSSLIPSMNTQMQQSQANNASMTPMLLNTYQQDAQSLEMQTQQTIEIQAHIQELKNALSQSIDLINQNLNTIESELLLNNENSDNTKTVIAQLHKIINDLIEDLTALPNIVSKYIIHLQTLSKPASDASKQINAQTIQMQQQQMQQQQANMQQMFAALQNMGMMQPMAQGGGMMQPINNMMGQVQGVMPNMIGQVQGVIGQMQGMAQNGIGQVSNLMNNAQGTIQNGMGRLQNIGQGVIGQVQGMVNNVGQTINQNVQSATGAIQNFGTAPVRTITRT